MRTQKRSGEIPDERRDKSSIKIFIFRTFAYNPGHYNTLFMNLRQKRLADSIRAYASEDIQKFEEFHDHDFGIISVVEVIVTPDYEYADIYISAQRNEKELPHFVAKVASETRRRIVKDFSLRKTPLLRYKLGSKQKDTGNILSLIHSLDQQYGLSREDS